MMKEKNFMVTKRGVEKIYENGEKQFIDDLIAKEIIFTLLVNGIKKQVFYCSPADLIPLSFGYLYIEGQINYMPLGAIPDVVIESDNEMYLDLPLSFNEPRIDTSPRETFLANITPLQMMDYEETLLQASSVFKQTGAIHGAALFYQDKLAFLGEDISRYYAFYKVVGKALMAKYNLSAMCLCTTGRLPVGYIEKVAKVGISLIISRSAPTDLALKTADYYGIQVAGFANSKRVNLYQKSIDTAVLAGGYGKRAENADKSQWRINGESFLNHICQELPEEKFLWISYNRSSAGLENLPKRAVVLNDDIVNIGPMGGIYTILKHSNSGGVLFVPCDMPFYNKKIGDVLLENYTYETDVVVIKTEDGKIQPLCGIYGKNCLPIIEECIKKKHYKITKLLDMLRVKYVCSEDFNLPSSWFSNINTIEEYGKMINTKIEIRN